MIGFTSVLCRCVNAFKRCIVYNQTRPALGRGTDHHPGATTIGWIGKRSGQALDSTARKSSPVNPWFGISWPVPYGQKEITVDRVERRHSRVREFRNLLFFSVPFFFFLSLFLDHEIVSTNALRSRVHEWQ